MKDKIIEIYIQALIDDLPPNVFADQILNLFGIKNICFNSAIYNPHFDKNGVLDGGFIFENGVLIGHADPKGEPGISGEPGKIKIN